MICMCVRANVCASVGTSHTRRGLQIPQSWSCRQLWATWCGWWKQNSCTWKEQQVLLSAESSVHHSWFCFKYVFFLVHNLLYSENITYTLSRFFHLLSLFFLLDASLCAYWLCEVSYMLSIAQILMGLFWLYAYLCSWESLIIYLQIGALFWSKACLWLILGRKYRSITCY